MQPIMSPSSWNNNMFLPLTYVIIYVLIWKGKLYGHDLYMLFIERFQLWQRKIVKMLCDQWKFFCKSISKQLNVKLESRFQAHPLMNTIGIIYLQYWLWGDLDSTFTKYLERSLLFFQGRWVHFSVGWFFCCHIMPWTCNKQ